LRTFAIWIRGIRSEALAMTAEKTELAEYRQKYGRTFVMIESDHPTPLHLICKVTFRTEVGQFDAQRRG